MAYPGATSADWTVTLSDVQEGSTIYVVGVFPNFASTYPNMAVSDGTNTYTLLDRYDDLPLLNQGIKGSQTVAHWYAANVPAGSYSINMAPSPATFEDWVGVVAFEITGASSEPLDGHAISFQGDLAPGTDTLNVAVTNTSTQGLYIAFTFNDVDYLTPTAPLLGTGFTAAYGTDGSGALMDFTKSGMPSATAEYHAISAAGTHNATFSPQEPEGDGQYPDYMTTGVIFK